MNSKNTEAKLLKQFMHSYSSISATKNYKTSVQMIQNADAIMVLGTKIASDSPVLYETLQSLSKVENAKICAIIENSYDISLYVASNLVDASFKEIEELPEFNGTVIYNADGLDEDAKISDGDFISIAFDEQTINREFKINKINQNSESI